jgi:hypothetical protein
MRERSSRAFSLNDYREHIHHRTELKSYSQLADGKGSDLGTCFDTCYFRLVESNVLTLLAAPHHTAGVGNMLHSPSSDSYSDIILRLIHKSCWFWFWCPSTRIRCLECDDGLDLSAMQKAEGQRRGASDDLG